MFNESYEDFQYDSCVSRGICSVSPRTSALQAVLILYLKLFAKYADKIELDKDCQNFILNTLSITVSNLEFNEKSFLFAIERFKKEIPRIIKTNLEKCSSDDMQQAEEKALEMLGKTSDIVNAIKIGERILNGSNIISNEIRNLYNIMLVVAKSISINILELESYEAENKEAFQVVLNLLREINSEKKDIKTLEEQIRKATKFDVELMRQIREIQEKRYGKQGVSEVSYSTAPNKAVLVVGSNIRELETVLEAFNNTNIDVYTHDDMMMAHTFPYFADYPNLKGQFGQGMENCLLDFATFPGPIILTKHSLHNIENFYRGRLFTTDYESSPRGIITIKDGDFSEVIKAAESSKGFKTGKQCETIQIGYNYDQITEKIKTKIELGKYDKIFIFGLDGYSQEQKIYFEKLVKLLPKKVLILSFSYEIEKDNFIHINTCFDYFSWIKIFEFVKQFNLSITVFVPKCERNTISQIVYLSSAENTDIYLGKCTPIMLNPSLMKTLQKTFKIKSITNVKKDLEEIFEDK